MKYRHHLHCPIHHTELSKGQYDGCRVCLGCDWAFKQNPLNYNFEIGELILIHHTHVDNPNLPGKLTVHHENDCIYILDKPILDFSSKANMITSLKIKPPPCPFCRTQLSPHLRCSPYPNGQPLHECPIDFYFYAGRYGFDLPIGHVRINAPSNQIYSPQNTLSLHVDGKMPLNRIPMPKLNFTSIEALTNQIKIYLTFQ